MTVLSLIVGYAIGSLPTAGWLARLWGVDIRGSGSGNPGANNARRLGGTALGMLVLVVELGKGVVAVVLGHLIGGDGGAVAAGLGAIGGNVYNVWYSFEGGKGLAITAGVLLAAWPTPLPILIVVLVLVTYSTRSSGRGALVTLAVLCAASLTWVFLGAGMAWGVGETRLLPLLGWGASLIMFQKHLYDARHPFRETAPETPRQPG